MNRASANPGASEADIQLHYDVGDDFYALFLDNTRTYSCGLWHQNSETLEQAQANKINHHLDSLKLPPKASVLDIGCGWGGLLQTGINRDLIGQAMGLTLSQKQHDHIKHNHQNINVKLQSWLDCRIDQQYDGIVSVGAFEHFTSPEQSAQSKLATYSDFFGFCHGTLKPNKYLSLQTIAYKNMSPENASSFIQKEIFPNSELPFAQEIISASSPYFELRHQQEDAEDYALTCELWLRNLKKNRQQAYALAGKATTGKFEQYLRMSSIGFRTGSITLLRMVFRKR